LAIYWNLFLKSSELSLFSSTYGKTCAILFYFILAKDPLHCIGRNLYFPPTKAKKKKNHHKEKSLVIIRCPTSLQKWLKGPSIGGYITPGKGHEHQLAIRGIIIHPIVSGNQMGS
jgi:hypothetical protein